MIHNFSVESEKNFLFLAAVEAGTEDATAAEEKPAAEADATGGGEAPAVEGDAEVKPEGDAETASAAEEGGETEAKPEGAEGETAPAADGEPGKASTRLWAIACFELFYCQTIITSSNREECS